MWAMEFSKRYVQRSGSSAFLVYRWSILGLAIA